MHIGVCARTPSHTYERERICYQNTCDKNSVTVATLLPIWHCVCLCVYIYIYIYIYTGCNRRTVPYFRRVFLMLNYTEKNPKHLYPKLNGYRDNGHRKVGASVVSTRCKLPADSPNACPPFCKVLYYILNTYLQADKAVDFAAECAVSHLTSERECHV
jgi:hypothetical protein